MSTILTDELTEKLLSLPASARARLAEALLASIEEYEAAPEIESAWRAEATRRYEAIQTGATTVRDGDDVMADARRRLE